MFSGSSYPSTSRLLSLLGKLPLFSNKSFKFLSHIKLSSTTLRQPPITVINSTSNLKATSIILKPAMKLTSKSPANRPLFFCSSLLKTLKLPPIISLTVVKLFPPPSPPPRPFAPTVPTNNQRLSPTAIHHTPQEFTS